MEEIAGPRHCLNGCESDGNSPRANFGDTCHLFLTMTTANKITILRILLIPFFVVEILYFVETGNELHRLLAILSFAIASILDAVDGSGRPR